MHLEWDITGTPVERLRECGYLRGFFEQADLTGMAPADALALGATEFVLADPGTSYLAYTRAVGALGLADLPAGALTLDWLDTVSGATQSQTVASPGGDGFFDRPAGFGNEVALRLAPAPQLIFSDGFESGDPSAWSTVVP